MHLKRVACLSLLLTSFVPAIAENASVALAGNALERVIALNSVHVSGWEARSREPLEVRVHQDLSAEFATLDEPEFEVEQADFASIAGLESLIPTGLRAEKVSFNSVKLAWDAVPNATAYLLEIEAIEGSWQSRSIDSRVVATEDLLLTDLSPDTFYLTELSAIGIDNLISEPVVKPFKTHAVVSQPSNSADPFEQQMPAAEKSELAFASIGQSNQGGTSTFNPYSELANGSQFTEIAAQSLLNAVAETGNVGLSGILDRAGFGGVVTPPLAPASTNPFNTPIALIASQRSRVAEVDAELAVFSRSLVTDIADALRGDSSHRNSPTRLQVMQFDPDLLNLEATSSPNYKTTHTTSWRNNSMSFWSNHNRKSVSATGFDGNLTSNSAGVDINLSNSLVIGIATTQNQLAQPDDRLPKDRSLSTALPYVRYKPDLSTSLWAAGSFGTSSTITNTDAAEQAYRMHMAGIRRSVLSFNGIEMAVHTDVASAAWKSSNEADVRFVDSVKITRVRAGLEVAGTFRTGRLGTVAPFFETNLRRDAGLLDQGVGVELAGGVRLSHNRFAFTAESRSLVDHTAESLQEKSVSVKAEMLSSTNGEGLTMFLQPRWGVQAPAGFDNQTFSIFSAFEEDTTPFQWDDYEFRLDGQFGYGLAWHNRNLLVTPFLHTEVADETSDATLAGIRLDVLRARDYAFNLEFVVGQMKRPTYPRSKVSNLQVSLRF